MQRHPALIYTHTYIGTTVDDSRRKWLKVENGYQPRLMRMPAGIGSPQMRPAFRFVMTARAANRRKGPLSAPRVHTKTAIERRFTMENAERA